MPIVMQSYVRDITILTKNQEWLKTAFRVLEPYLLLTVQKLNVTKTYAFAINHEEDLSITINEQTQSIGNKVNILGVKFNFYPNSFSFHYVADDLKFVQAALDEDRKLGVSVLGSVFSYCGIDCKVSSYIEVKSAIWMISKNAVEECYYF